MADEAKFIAPNTPTYADTSERIWPRERWYNESAVRCPVLRRLSWRNYLRVRT